MSGMTNFEMRRIGRTPALGSLSRARLVAAVKGWRELGLECWLQFSHEGMHKGYPVRHHGCLSALEDLQEALYRAGVINRWGYPRGKA